MSDNNNQDLVPGGQNEADEEAGLDLGSLGSALVPVEWLAAVAGVAALLAFQVVVKAFEEKGPEEEEAWPATSENKNMQLLDEEEEEEGEEEEELKAEHHQEVKEEDDGEEEEVDNKEEDGGHEENEEGAAAADFPEDRVPDAKTKCKLGYYFSDLMVPKPLSLLAKEATEYYYKKFNEMSKETGGENGEAERDENGELEEGPQKDLDSAEGSFR